MQNSKKKKLLYVITKSNWGGAQRYVFDLAANTAEQYEVSVAFGGEGELKTKLENAGIRTISLPFLKRDVSLFTDIVTFKKLIELFKTEKPDIIHVNSSKIGGIGSLAGRIAKVPRIIFTAHGWAFREERPAYQKIIIRFLSWVTILFSHAVITVSERDYREALAMPFTKEKIILIHNGIEKPDFLSQEEARESIINQGSIRPAVKKNENVLWVGSIGELHKNKGHIYAIEAISKLAKTSNVLFFIIGDGEEKSMLQQKIKEFGIEEKVFLLGRKNDAPNILKAFDVFLFPSIKEGLPFAILEAGMAALPTIASAVGGIPEIITDMQTGILIRPKNSDEIIKAIDYAISHPEKTAEFGRKLQTTVVKNFSLKKTIEKTKETYKINRSSC